MKRGSEYAKRVKQLFQQMTKKLGKPDLPEPTDPIEQLIIGILAENTSEAKAAATFKRVCETMVDLNELRVTPAPELADLIGNGVPQAAEKAERIVRVLNEIRQRQDTLDLSFLKQRGRREAREYLESLEGVGRAPAASVVVHSLGGHAIPVDYLTVYVLRKESVVNDEATLPEVQSFLERHVSATDTRAFVTLLNRHVAQEGARVQVHRLPGMLKLDPPEPPKPIKRQGMEKPRIAGLRGDDSPGPNAPAADEPTAPAVAAEPAKEQAEGPSEKPSSSKSSTDKSSTDKSSTDKASSDKAPSDKAPSGKPSKAKASGGKSSSSGKTKSARSKAAKAKPAPARKSKSASGRKSGGSGKRPKHKKK